MYAVHLAVILIWRLGISASIAKANANYNYGHVYYE